MKLLRNISIRRKITLIIMLVSLVSLTLAVSVFTFTERTNARQFAVNNLQTMAEIIAANSKAAILFRDNIAAEETLEFLKYQDNILAATIYGPDYEQFATYTKPGTEHKTPELHSNADNTLLWKNFIDISNTITHEGVHVGHVHLRSDIKLIHDHLSWYVIVALLVLFASLLLSFLLSERMQHIITDPLLLLSDIARQITTEKNYSLRLECESKDEVGNLMCDFNEMLEQIQIRDKELELHRSELEHLVAIDVGKPCRFAVFRDTDVLRSALGGLVRDFHESPCGRALHFRAEIPLSDLPGHVTVVPHEFRQGRFVLRNRQAA